MATSNYYYGLGRRKSAVARVRLFNGKGSLTVNDKPANDYFAGSRYLQNRLSLPFSALELDPEKYTVTVKVLGGGHSSQVDAIQLGIAKALVEMNEEFRATLRR